MRGIQAHGQLARRVAGRYDLRFQVRDMGGIPLRGGALLGEAGREHVSSGASLRGGGLEAIQFASLRLERTECRANRFDFGRGGAESGIEATAESGADHNGDGCVCYRD